MESTASSRRLHRWRARGGPACGRHSTRYRSSGSRRQGAAARYAVAVTEEPIFSPANVRPIGEPTDQNPQLWFEVDFGAGKVGRFWVDRARAYEWINPVGGVIGTLNEWADRDSPRDVMVALLGDPPPELKL